MMRMSLMTREEKETSVVFGPDCTVKYNDNGLGFEDEEEMAVSESVD